MKEDIEEIKALLRSDGASSGTIVRYSNSFWTPLFHWKHNAVYKSEDPLDLFDDDDDLDDYDKGDYSSMYPTFLRAILETLKNKSLFQDEQEYYEDEYEAD